MRNDASGAPLDRQLMFNYLPLCRETRFPGRFVNLFDNGRPFRELD